MTAARLAATAFAAGLLACAAPAVADPVLEIAVKAAYLYKFAPFVRWPPGTEARAPFAICVIGKDPFDGVLDRAVAGQRVGARPIVVRRMAAATAAAPCQIAYLGGSRAQPVSEALRLLHGAPVLTVTDGPPPGIVDFAAIDGRIRFRVDDQAAADSGLAVSSKLLRLAVSVNPRRSPGPGG